jgi:hypothetical protein
MSWLDNLLRRRQGRATESDERTAEVRRDVQEAQPPATEDKAGRLEQEVHEERDQNIMREPRLPPGMG